MSAPKLPLRERLYRYLEPCSDPDCDCLLWHGRTNWKGYGVIRVRASGKVREFQVHRVAWQAEVGPIPEGLQIDHVKAHGCKHRNCASVGHLEPVTSRENARRAEPWQTALTHCPRGHAYDDANTHRYRGQRVCRACRRARKRAARAA